MQDNQNSFYFTDRHRVISENTRTWNEQNIEYSHWEGHSRKCGDDTLRDIVKNYALAPSIACEHCGRRCSYRGQFSQRNRVFAPFDYLPTNYVMGELPDIIFLDESKVKVNKTSFDHNMTLQWLEIIANNSNMPTDFIDLMREGNYYFYIYGGFDDLSSYHREAQVNAFEERDFNNVRIIGSINPHSLAMYFRFAETYNDFQRDAYNIPFWYHALEVANMGKRVVLLDASFNKDWFEYLLECYNGEVGFNGEISVKIYSTDVVNHSTIVYNMRHGRRGSWIPKVSVKGYAMTWFPQHLKKIKEIYGEENVGLITFKEVLKPKYAELFDIQYFGNLRSSNIFKDKRVLVVFGTYFGTQNQVFTHLKEIFDVNDEEQIIEQEESRQWREVEMNFVVRSLIPDGLYDTVLRPKRRRRFSDANPIDAMNPEEERYVLPVTWLQDGIWDSEMYQAFHRNRGLQNKRIIFAYCWFPLQILKEFKIESVNRNKNDEEKFWEKLEKEEIQNRLIESFIDDINLADRPNLMKTYLSEKYKMFGSENRDKIQEFINRYLEIKDGIKPPRK